MSVGEVEEPAEVLQAKGTKVTEVQDRQTIRTGCSRIAAVLDGMLHLCAAKNVCVVVEWVLSADLSEYVSCLWIGIMGDWSSELVAELSGYCLWFRVCLVIEGDRLVRVLVWPLS